MDRMKLGALVAPEVVMMTISDATSEYEAVMVITFPKVCIKLKWKCLFAYIYIFDAASDDTMITMTTDISMTLSAIQLLFLKFNWFDQHRL